MATLTDARKTVIRTAPLFFVNSVLAAGIGVIIARMVELVSVAVVGMIMGRDPVLRLSGVELRADGSDWIAAAGPAGTVLVGLALLLLYPGSKDRSAGRLAMLWAMLFSFRSGLVAVASGALDETTPLGTQMASLELPGGIDTVIAVAAIAALVLVSVGAAPAFLSFARHRSEVATKLERLRFVGSIALVPAVFGPLLAIPTFIPDEGSGFIATLPFVGLFILITLIAAPFTTAFRPPDVVEERGLSMGLLAAFVIVTLAFRFGVGSGIPVPPWDENLDFTWRA